MATKKRTSEPIVLGRLVDPDEAERLVEQLDTEDEQLDTEDKLVADRLLTLWEGVQGRVANPRRPFSISADPRMWWIGLPQRGGQYPIVTKDRQRWRLVCILHDEFGLTWEETFQRASGMSAGTSMRGGVETMKRAYKKIERDLPEEDRRTGERKGKRRHPLG